MFQRIDQEKNAFLTEAELKQGLIDMGFTCTDEQLEVILKTFFPPEDVEDEAEDETDDFTEARRPMAANINYHVRMVLGCRTLVAAARVAPVRVVPLASLVSAGFGVAKVPPAAVLAFDSRQADMTHVRNAACALAPTLQTFTQRLFS